MRELSLTTEAVNNIVKLDTVIDERYKPKGGPIIRMADVKNLEAFLHDPQVAELHNAISDLRPEQQIELKALVWLGRGYDERTFNENLELAKSHSLEGVEEYLSAKPLRKFLPQGIEKLKAEGITLSNEF